MLEEICREVSSTNFTRKVIAGIALLLIVCLFVHYTLYNFQEHFSSVWDESTSKRDESTKAAAYFTIWLLHDRKNNVTGITGVCMRLFSVFLLLRL